MHPRDLQALFLNTDVWKTRSDEQIKTKPRQSGVFCCFSRFHSDHSSRQIIDKSRTTAANQFDLDHRPMATGPAAWLRLNEVFTSTTDTVCLIARVQSINLSQRALMIYDDDDDHGRSTASSALHVSLANLRPAFDIHSSILSPGQCIQLYGKLIRQSNKVIRLDAQFLRPLGKEFDLKEYHRGLTITRQFMSSVGDASR